MNSFSLLSRKYSSCGLNWIYIECSVDLNGSRTCGWVFNLFITLYIKLPPSTLSHKFNYTPSMSFLGNIQAVRHICLEFMPSAESADIMIMPARPLNLKTSFACGTEDARNLMPFEIFQQFFRNDFPTTHIQTTHRDVYKNCLVCETHVRELIVFDVPLQVRPFVRSSVQSAR